MNRREIREQLFVLLFQKEFYGEAFEEQRDLYFQTKEWSEKDRQYITEHLQGVMSHLPEIDEKIAENSKGWQIDRIGKEELAILRLSLYEALFDDEIPVGVAVNEAVELGKMYGAEGGAAFINGILGNIVNE